MISLSTIGNGSLHALRVLRWHGLPAEALSTVTEATIISRLLYASPAWWGLTSAEDRARLESFLKEETAATPVPLVVGRVI